MKFITILLTILALKSCGNTKTTASKTDSIEGKQTSSLSGKYLISSFIDNTELPENIHLNFDESSNSVSGFAGCNTFSTDYTINGNSIKFGAFMSTKMMCKRFMDVEQNLIKTLGNTTIFSIENNMLTLKNNKEDLIFATKNDTSKRIQGDDYSIVYNAITRGSYLSITIKEDSIVYQKERNSKPESRKFSPKEATNIFQKVAVLKVEELESLESPSAAHQYDGAAGATLTIIKNGKTYETQTFDHGNPNTKIEDLVHTILSMTEKQ